MHRRGNRFGWLLAGSAMAFAGAASAAENVTYRYDSLGRLIRIERSGSVNNAINSNYCYDAADNRAKVKSGAAVPPAPPPASAPTPVPSSPSPQPPAPPPSCG